jgi:hypothetical protein
VEDETNRKVRDKVRAFIQAATAAAPGGAG